MNNLITFIAILTLGVGSAQQEPLTMSYTTQTLLELMPVKGTRALKIDFDNHTFVTTAKSIRFVWPDGTSRRFAITDRDDQKMRFDSIIKKMNENPYTWVYIKDRIYRYNH